MSAQSRKFIPFYQNQTGQPVPKSDNRSPLKYETRHRQNSYFSADDASINGFGVKTLDHPQPFERRRTVSGVADALKISVEIDSRHNLRRFLFLRELGWHGCRVINTFEQISRKIFQKFNYPVFTADTGLSPAGCTFDRYVTG